MNNKDHLHNGSSIFVTKMVNSFNYTKNINLTFGTFCFAHFFHLSKDIAPLFQ